MNRDFIGAGWAHPLDTDVTGGIALVRRDVEVRQAIMLILGTSPGERPMRPEFGCRVHERVFGPVNSVTASQIGFDVRDALERWEPRITVEDVAVTFAQEGSDSMFQVDVSYSIVGSNDPRNLVFPFYVIPDELAAPPSLPVKSVM